MIDSQVRTSYGSLDASTLGISPSARQKARTANVPTPTAPINTQGPGFSTYVTAPSTLLAAQETRNVGNVRRDGTSQSQAKPQEQHSRSDNPQDLSDEEQKRVQELKKIDREVRAHERAHRAAGGTLTGSAQFTYTRGPDGQQYAVSGEVSIDTGREQSPAATAAKMEAVIRAALAPANPSAQDVAVAAQARQVLNEVAQAAREERLNLDETQRSSVGAQQDGGQNAPAHSEVFKANRAYQIGGAQNGQDFRFQQARKALFIYAEQSVNIII